MIDERPRHISFLFERLQPDGGDTFAFFDDLLLKYDRLRTAAESARDDLRDGFPTRAEVILTAALTATPDKA